MLPTKLFIKGVAFTALMGIALGSVARAQISDSYDRKGPWGTLPGGMHWPGAIGIASAPNGNIYVLTRCHDNSCAGRPEPAIYEFDRSGKALKSFGAGLFDFPHGLYVDAEGNIWATDTQTHQVLKFNPDGKVLLTIGKKGTPGNPPDLLTQPNAVLVNKEGDIFIAEGHGDDVPSRIDRYNKDGRFVKSFGTHGTAEGQINVPHCMAFDSKGRLFIGDRSNNRISVFTQDGQFIEAWRQFGRPSGIYIAKDDTLYVSDSESNSTAPHSDNPGIKRGIRIGSAKDGKVTHFVEEIEWASHDPSGPENMTVDKDGMILGANVRRRMVETYSKVK